MFKFLSIGAASANVVTYFNEGFEVVPKNSIVTFGFDQCTWCQEYTPLFVQAAQQYVGPVQFGVIGALDEASEKYQVIKS